MIRALILSTALLMAGPALAQNAAAPAPAPSSVEPMNVTDPTQFGTMASISNLFEIQSSELALERATSPEVRAFAEQMIADHGQAAEDMMAAAQAEGVTLPTALDARHQQMLDTIAQAGDADFDAAYVAAQVQAHDEAVALFQGYATNGADGPLKDFAAATLPVLEMHQQHVRSLATQ